MPFVFGDYLLDAGRRELLRKGEAVHVEPQVFDVLLHLVRNRDRVVTKDDLIASVWQGRIVSESTLANRINAARNAIGDSGERQQFIRTVARRGLRFVGEVRDAADAERTERPGAPDGENTQGAARQNSQAAGDAANQPLPLPDKPSVAVLPFANLSDDPAQEYFAEGMAEEIITALSRCSWLFVISRNSSFTYKGKAVDVRRVGRELGVRYVLEGSVRRAGERLRFAARFVEAASGAHIWADRFEGEKSDVFELQDRITESVVATIEPSLQRAEIERLRQKPAANLDAYDLYLRAVQLEYEFTEAGLAEAIRLLARAAALDPGYAPAMALSAFCYAERAFQAWADDYKAEVAEAVRLANRAVELDPNDANVLWMSAYAIGFLGGDSARSNEIFARSLSINPNSPMALTTSCWPLSVLGDTAAMLDRLARARRLSPRDPREWMITMTTSMAHMWARDFSESVAWAEKALRQNPRALPALRTLVVGLVHSDRQERACEVVQQILRIDPKFTISGWQRQRAPQYGASNPRWQFILDAYRAAGVPE
jgi:TolB-like protein